MNNCFACKNTSTLYIYNQIICNIWLCHCCIELYNLKLTEAPTLCFNKIFQSPTYIKASEDSKIYYNELNEL